MGPALPGSGSSLYENVRETHELDEVEELRGGIAEPDPATAAARGDLEARERLDRDRVGLDSGDVARDHGAARRQERAHAVAETRQVFAGDRAADGERDLVRLRLRHRHVDPRGDKN